MAIRMQALTTPGVNMRSIEDQIAQKQLAEDTKIQARVNAAHREAFYNKYPGQIEHCLRLATEQIGRAHV